MRSAVMRSKRYNVTDKFTKSGAYTEITVSRENLFYAYALQVLKSMRQDFPAFITKSQFVIAKRFIDKMKRRDFLPRGHSRYKTLYDYYASRRTRYTIELKCELVTRSQPNCYLHVDSFME